MQHKTALILAIGGIPGDDRLLAKKLSLCIYMCILVLGMDPCINFPIGVIIGARIHNRLRFL